MLRFTVLACLLLAANAAPEETIPEALQDLMNMADADPTQFAADLKVRTRFCNCFLVAKERRERGQ
jgi:hypothetical protein